MDLPFGLRKPTSFQLLNFEDEETLAGSIRLAERKTAVAFSGSRRNELIQQETALGFVRFQRRNRIAIAPPVEFATESSDSIAPINLPSHKFNRSADSYLCILCVEWSCS